MTVARTPVSADDILAIVTGCDGTSIAVIHDKIMRRFDVICPQHMVGSQGFYSFQYTPAATVADHAWFRKDAVLVAAKHAAARHITPRVDSAGDAS